jgi:signal transduction histidine kinase
MQRRETAPPSEESQRPNATAERAGRRPTLRRFPLIAFLATGIICLKYLDGRLSSDHRRSAADLAVQADALIEAAVAYRATSLHELRQLVATGSTPTEQRARFSTLGLALHNSTPEIIRIYRLDARGNVRDYVPRESTADDLTKENHLLVAETAGALSQALRTDAPATSGVIALRNETLGFVIYDPIVIDGRVDGYVGAAVAYGPLLRSVLTQRLQGRFGYRITDSATRVLAVSPGFPTRISSFATQRVGLPGGGYWQIDVPLGVFQPRAARVTMWIVGVVLLCLVFLLVLREDARADRIAMHSFNLELLSRDLLDANVRLEDRAQQINEANMAKSRFLANVSHELRTPLNAIVGYNALALSGLYGEVTPELRGAHDRIRAAADHLLRVVNDVLDLSKIEVGRMEIDLRSLSLEPLLEDVVSLVEPVAEAKGVRIDLVVARDLPDVITDGRHLRQILMNLMTNAIKFTERGSVTVVARRGDEPDASSALIIVEDTGIGIAERDLDRIFDEFEQVRPSARGDSIARGTGLGLTVSRKLARLLGGEVGAASHVGAGSRFTLTLPFEPPAEVSARAKRGVGSATRDRRRHTESSAQPSAEEGSTGPLEAGRRP